MPFVIDNSVVSGWYIKEQATPYTSAILERLKNDTAHSSLDAEDAATNAVPMRS